MPFGPDQFFGVVQHYNQTLWLAVLVLWLASLAAVVSLISHRRAPNRIAWAVFALQWAWSAIAYHAAFFTRINPAAWLFAALFLVQAVLLLRWGVLQGRADVSARSSKWMTFAWLLIGYSFAYPAITAAQYGVSWRMATFGVPCPTTILTAGLLVLARAPWWLAMIPIAWSAIGGSAAWLLNVHADLALPIAGVGLVVALITRVEFASGCIAPGSPHASSKAQMVRR